MKFKLAVLVAALGLVMVASDSLVAQRGRTRGGWGGEEMREMFRQMGNMQLLSQQSIIKDMDLSDEQQDNLKKLGEDVRAEMRDMWRSMQGKSQEERSEEIKSFMTDLKGEMDKILLPHQRKRFRQITLQNSMRRGRGRTGGVTALLQNKGLMKELGYDEEELKELMDKVKKKTEEVNEEVNRKVAKIREEGQKEVMSVLPKKLQNAIKEQLGESFDFNTMQNRWMRGRDRGGDRGGDKGGDRGRRGRDGGGGAN